MKRYEYMVQQIQISLKSVFTYDKSEYNKQISEKLNEFGEEGWELCGVDGTWFYFRREVK